MLLKKKSFHIILSQKKKKNKPHTEVLAGASFHHWSQNEHGKITHFFIILSHRQNHRHTKIKWEKYQQMTRKKLTQASLKAILRMLPHISSG